MRFTQQRDIRNMLGAAWGAAAVDGSGRSDLASWLSLLKRGLPTTVQRRLPPSDGPSALVYLAYAWTALYTAITAIDPIINPADRRYLPLALVYIALGLAGLWFGTRLAVLLPALLLWLLAAATVFTQPTVGGFTLGVCFLIGAWFAGRSVVQRGVNRSRSTKQAEIQTNQLGWDLYRLSSETPATDETVDRISVYHELRVGELERHFDQTTSAAIQGGMQHVFNLRGTSSSIHDLPGIFLADTQSWMSLGGTGASNVQLAMAGTTSDELTGEAFVAVFERTVPGALDTIRAVVPSERQARVYVNQLLAYLSNHFGPGTASELMVRRYTGALIGAVTSDSSYVGDRLNAILRLPAADRPLVTLIGEPLNEHAVLVGAIRFGSTGPLFQLFPIALVRSLVALIDGRPLPPQPPASLPPSNGTSDSQSESETADPIPEATSSNGHISGLHIRTLGGLRIQAGADDLTSALLDRKVLAFLWLHLFARTLRNPDDTITRSSLADELSPGLDGSAQRSRLRGRLSELRNQLPEALGRRVKVSGERISLDLTDCVIDLRDVADAEKTYGSSNGVLTSEQLVQLESVLAPQQGTFLPEWDELEQHVNGGRSGAGEVVGDLRRRADAALAASLRALGSAYLAHGKPDAAVPPLERALQLTPEDEAIARSLVAACAQSGRLARAEELRKDFSLV